MSSRLKCIFIVLLVALFSSKGFSQYFTSNLPLVIINTNGQQIIDDPKIIANLGIIWNGPGKRNAQTDPMNDFNGIVGIEIRGSSSQMFPKKSYGFEIRSDAGVSINASLLGMPAESDWVLYAPYTDKTMIRDVLTYTLDASLGHWSPRCRFVEVFLNNQYQGVYVLMEKIKRNKKRVDIAKLTTSDITGEAVTGGYIIKIDKTTGSDREGWNSTYPNVSGSTYYLYDYPKYNDITSSQKVYIQNYVKAMETSLYLNKYAGAGNYHEYLNDSSFIDFMIMNELSKNVDGYRLSSYLYKGKNKLINCGPIWDFNLGYGNADYYNGWITYGFQYETNLTQNGQPDGWQTPFWWGKLVNDNVYSQKLKRRWSLLRKNEFSNQRINFVTDSLVDLLSESQYRNYLKWPILGQYIWPNYYVGGTYKAEVNWMKDWITQRLSSLDFYWQYDFTGIADPLAAKSGSIFPNPFSDRLTIQVSQQISGEGFAEIYSLTGSLLQKSRVAIQSGQIQLEFSGKNTLSPGLIMVRVTFNNQILLNEKVMKIQ